MVPGSRGLIQHCDLWWPLELCFKGQQSWSKQSPGTVGRQPWGPALLLFSCACAASRPAVLGFRDSRVPAPGMLEQQRTPTQGKRAWLHLRKLGQCWEEPLALEGRTGRPWDVDQEAVVPPPPTSPHAPTHVWAPRHGTQSFLCAGARLLEKRPAVWEQGRRVPSWGSC